METRRIGSLDVTVVGIGCNNFGGRIDAASAQAVVDAALGEGINFFDTADIYGGSLSEEYLGRALGSRRDQVVIASKFGIAYTDMSGGASANYVRQALEASLGRLGTDRIELYQLHAPDDSVPIEETLGALAELVAEGKVVEIGCSNFSVEQLQQAAEAAAEGGTPRFVSVQNKYSILHREPESGVLDECSRQGMAFIPYSPVASGVLTGKFRAGQEVPEGTRIGNMAADQRARELSAERLALVEELVSIAEADGRTILDLAFAWLLAHQQVASVIAGATKPEQVRANAATATYHPAADVLQRVNAMASR